MLIFTRKSADSIIMQPRENNCIQQPCHVCPFFGESVQIFIMDIKKQQVRIGIEASEKLLILRGELLDPP